MKKVNLKENVKKSISKLKNKIWMMPVTLMLLQTKV